MYGGVRGERVIAPPYADFGFCAKKTRRPGPAGTMELQG
jgi:hypothetical protein